MIVLLIFLIIISISLIILQKNSFTTYWMSALLLGWFFSIFGILIFIAKYGGFYYKVNNILFLNDSVRYLLLISPFSINTISRMISIGRSIFIFSLTGFCINLCKKSLKFSSVFYILSALFSILNIIFYDPKVYKMFINTLAKETIFSISIITRLWLICSFIFSTIIMIKKYRKTSIPWIKKNLKYIYSGLYSLIIFYFYLGFMGPLQVTDIRTYYFLYSDFSNFNPPLTLIEWYSYILITIVTSILSTVYLWKYTNIESKLGKSYMQLSRKLKTADMGVKVFTHGIKNQLIMLQLLVNQTIDLYNKNNNISEEDDKIKVNLYKSQEILNHTMNRMDDLYKSFKNSNLQLRPFSANKIIESTIDKIKIIPENVNFQYKLLDEDLLILADYSHLTECLYNIIINAFESIPNDKPGYVNVISYCEYSWFIIKIQDTGCGIDKKALNKIFDPFYTKKNTAKNWGVGLSYAKQIINGHMGHIDVSSNIDEGSSFCIFIPIYKLNN